MTRPITVRIDVKTYDNIVKFAEEFDVSKSVLVRELLQAVYVR